MRTRRGRPSVAGRVWLAALLVSALASIVGPWSEAAKGPVKKLREPVEQPQEPEQKSAGPFHYDAGGRRDPFLPLVRDGRLVATTTVNSSEGDKPVLYGILWDPRGYSFALINDAEVKVGDEVGNYRVSEIRHDAVVLDNGGEPLVLSITFDTPQAKPAPHTTKGGDGQ